MIADIDGELGGATADAITAAGGSARAVVTDVRAPDQVTGLARTVLDEHGRVDVLVNNVGHWLRHPETSSTPTRGSGMSSTGSTSTTSSCSPGRSCPPWWTGTPVRS